MIKAYINRQRQILIDPNVIINTDNSTYDITFQFQSKLPSGYTYYLVLKPIFDIPRKIMLDDNLHVTLPQLSGICGEKVGIGLQAIRDNDRYCTDYYYVPIKRGASHE